MWGAHVRQIAPKAYPVNGRFAKLFGEADPGNGLNPRQKILVGGARIVDAVMTHAVMSYEGSVRLLTFKGGSPLPWSSMVLARTAFEATLRVLWILDPMASNNLLLARIAATEFEELYESRKLHLELPDELSKEILFQNQMRNESLKQSLSAIGFTVIGGGKSGKVVTPEGEHAAFPFGLTDASNLWWASVGVYTYRWLSIFTHAGSASVLQLDVPVAAVDSKDTYLVLGLLTDALWKAMDSYSIWVGMSNRFVRRKLVRIYEFLRRRAPVGSMQARPPSEVEKIFLDAAEALKETGSMHPKAIRNCTKWFVHRIGM